MNIPGVRRELLETFVPLNTLPEERLDYLLRDVSIVTLLPEQTLPMRVDDSDKTVYLLSGILEFHDGAEDEMAGSAKNPRPVRPVRQLSAGETQSWYPVAASNSCRVVARTTVNCIMIDKDRLDRVLSWEQTARYFEADLAFELGLEDSRWLRKLLKAPMFYHMPAVNIRAMFQKMIPVRVVAGEAVVRLGGEADACYFIRQGQALVNVQPVNVLEDPGLEICVAVLGPGQYFGEEGLLYSGKRNATVRMATDGELLRLERVDFDALIKAPVVSMVTAAEVVQRGMTDWLCLDVRLAEECQNGMLPGAINIPLQSLRSRMALLEKPRRYLIYCDTGRRSSAAAFLLNGHGFLCDVLEGGIQGVSEAQWQQLLHPGTVA